MSEATTKPTNWRAVIDLLTPAQVEVLGRICLDENTNLYNKRTLKVLMDKGLIQPVEKVLPGRFPVTLTMYTWSCWGVHIAWCAWCSDNCRDE